MSASSRSTTSTLESSSQYNIDRKERYRIVTTKCAKCCFESHNGHLRQLSHDLCRGISDEMLSIKRVNEEY